MCERVWVGVPHNTHLTHTLEYAIVVYVVSVWKDTSAVLELDFETRTQCTQTRDIHKQHHGQQQQVVYIHLACFLFAPQTTCGSANRHVQ